MNAWTERSALAGLAGLWLAGLGRPTWPSPGIAEPYAPPEPYYQRLEWGASNALPAWTPLRGPDDAGDAAAGEEEGER